MIFDGLCFVFTVPRKHRDSCRFGPVYIRGNAFSPGLFPIPADLAIPCFTGG